MAVYVAEASTATRAITTADTRACAERSEGSALRDWAREYARAHVDLGTGDGMFAIDLARRCPEVAVLGLDTNLDHLRGSAKRRPGNLRFVTADALGWSLGTLPAADTVTINFPYGSLLRGLVAGDPDLLERLDALVGRGGRIEIRVNASALVATGIPPAGAPEAIARALRRIDGLRTSLRALDRAALRSFQSSWAKRLGHGRETDAFLIEATRRA